MNKIKSFIFEEKRLSKTIFGLLVVAALAFIFGPNVYAQFARQDGAAGWGYGYGYGYGYGSGTDDGSYRIGGSDVAADYEYNYGWGFIETYDWVYSSCSATCGGGTRTATCKNSSSQPVDSGLCTTTAVTSCNTQSCGSSGGGGGGSYNSQTCTSVTYGDYTVACFGTYNFRAVLTRTPANCTLTADQQAATQRTCATGSIILPVTAVNGVGLTMEAQNTANFIAREKNLVKKINKALAKRLAGRILLQVQEHGEAWYVNPLNLGKYYMGRPADAFALMRKLALGISNKDFASYKNNTAPARLSGRILLKVEDSGRAYYVNPVNLKMYYLGRPADAFSIMRSLGLGITNADLRQIEVIELK